MKCMKKGEKVQRVSETEASTLVKSGWSYINKTAWKLAVRGAVKEVPAAEVAAEGEGSGDEKPRKKKYQKRSAEQRDAEIAEKKQERFKKRTQ